MHQFPLSLLSLTLILEISIKKIKNLSFIISCVATTLFFKSLIGGMMSFMVKSKTEDSVKCEVIDGGELKSRRHLNVRGKSATLPSITGWTLNQYILHIPFFIEVSFRVVRD